MEKKNQSRKKVKLMKVVGGKDARFGGAFYLVEVL